MDKEKLIARIRTVKGHLSGIEKMIQEDKNCRDIMVQISAVKSSIDKIGQFIIENYAQECLIDAVEGDRQKLETKVKDTLNLIMKFSR